MSANHPHRFDVCTLGVCPCLTYRDVRRALAWLETAFGIHGQPLAPPDTSDNASIEHALIHLGSATILVESERPDELHGPHVGRGWTYVAVSDADTHHARARAEGARVLSEPHDFGDGYRGYSVTDPEGNLWTFGTANP